MQSYTTNSIQFTNSHQEQSSNTKNKPKQESPLPSHYKFYRPSQRNGDRFDLRFQQIKGSLVDQNPLQTLGSLASWKLSSLTSKNVSWPNPEELKKSLPMQSPPKFETFDNKIVYTWIGHSTAVISLGKQINILIDPVFGQRCSPYPKIGGPSRFQNAPCQINDQTFPNIDLVLVSHDHYDHLQTDSLEKIYKKSCPIFIAGKGSQDVFPSDQNFIELDWTQDITLSKNKDGKLHEVQNEEFDRAKKQNSENLVIRVTFVPACHYGRRWTNDMCKRLWGGFVIEAKDKKIFYSGDTGKCGVFKEIGKKFKQFDLSILPIGAYEPRKYLKCQHVNPQQAVEIHMQVNSKKSVGVHWGTFPLGDEKFDQARDDLKVAVKKFKLKEDSSEDKKDGQFVTIQHGGSLVVDF